MANDGTGLTSVGLMGLPHFRTSRVSREMYEPVYLNLFTVEIQLPKKLTGDGGISNEDKNLLLEGPVVSHNGKEYKKERVCVCNSNFAVQQSKFTNTTL